MNCIKMCFNPRVLVGLAAVAAGFVLFRPDLALAALPVLLALACPLSMAAMLLFMGRRHGPAHRPAPAPPEGETREERLQRLQEQLRDVDQRRAVILAELQAGAGGSRAGSSAGTHPAARQAG